MEGDREFLLVIHRGTDGLLAEDDEQRILVLLITGRDEFRLKVAAMRRWLTLKGPIN